MKDGVLKWTHGPSFEEGGVRFRLWAPKEERIALMIDGRDPDRNGAQRRWLSSKSSSMACLRAHATCLRSRADNAFPIQRLVFSLTTSTARARRSTHAPIAGANPGKAANGTSSCFTNSISALFRLQGTFAGAALKLDHLADLGVTAVEIMPVSDFKGRWNWGYDGAFPYAPDASYGRPEDFKAFVEAAHERGIAVLLDVVYNHFGPEGNFLSLYAPDFFTSRHKTPWGDAIQFDGPNSRPVRDFFIENAEYWLEEFHLDGLRFDAVHAIKDDSRPDLLDELAARLRARFSRPIHLILENEDNVPQPPDAQRRQGRSLHRAMERRHPSCSSCRRHA